MQVQLNLLFVNFIWADHWEILNLLSVFVVYLLQCLSKDRKRQKQLNINHEDTKHSMFDKTNIDELYPFLWSPSFCSMSVFVKKSVQIFCTAQLYYASFFDDGGSSHRGHRIDCFQSFEDFLQTK